MASHDHMHGLVATKLELVPDGDSDSEVDRDMEAKKQKAKVWWNTVLLRGVVLLVLVNMAFTLTLIVELDKAKDELEQVQKCFASFAYAELVSASTRVRFRSSGNLSGLWNSEPKR